MVGQPDEAFVEPDASPRGAVGHLVVGGDEVASPELDGVHAEAAGQLVEELFEGERRLGRTGRTVGARARPGWSRPRRRRSRGHPSGMARWSGSRRSPRCCSRRSRPSRSRSRARRPREPAVARAHRARRRGSRPGPGWSSGSPRAGSARRGRPGAARGSPPRPAARGSGACHRSPRPASRRSPGPRRSTGRTAWPAPSGYGTCPASSS